MQINKARFTTATRHALAVGVVVAFIAPAANVLSLDVVPSAPDHSVAAPSSTAVVTTAAVPVASVEPQVSEYELTETTPKAAVTGTEAAEPDAHEGHEGHTHGLDADVAAEDVVAADVTAPVAGYGAVGVTWSADAQVSPGELALEVRTRSGDEWSDWTDMPYSDDHAPDEGSQDALNTRAGTEAVVIGEVDEVEVRAEGAGALPAELQLAVVDPGTVESRVETPEIAAATNATAPAAEDGLELSAASVSAPRPTIYSRAQWGADEKLRGGQKPSYGTVTGGFVHHTVNANNYTADEVPGIIRSIYAYHTKSRGWSDVGYNFLVDRFGRIWEGRYGGVDKAVVGAHTLNYNQYSFAMSAIGNFETAAPSQAMIDAYGSLMAWKLGLHGVKASNTKQKIGSGTFHAINGHRDAASTACPGKNLYAKLGEIRKRAASLQGTTVSPPAVKPTPAPTPEPEGTQFSAPVLQSNLIGTAHPDILVRRASDKKLFVIPTGGLSELNGPTTLYKGWKTTTRVHLSDDMTGDGKADLVTIAADGTTKVRKGIGNGKFSGSGVTTWAGTKKHSLVVPAGDLNGDGLGDMIGRNSTGRAVVFQRTKSGKFIKMKNTRAFGTLSSIHPVGDITGDGYPDLVVRRKKDGAVFLMKSTGKRTFGASTKLAGDWSKLKDVVGGVDFDRDGRKDIVFRNTDGNVWVLPGLGNGTFEPPLGPIATNASVTGLSIAPIHGNGFPDVVARSGKSVVLLKNSGKFEIGTAVSLKVAMPTATHVFNAGDWNRDGKGDVMAVRENGQLILRTGDGMGGLSTSTVVGSGFEKVTGLQAVGDVTGDGHADLVGTLNGVTTVYPGQGGKKKLKAGIAAPGFKAPLARLTKKTGYDATQYDWKITVGDVRLAKGNTDLVVRERGTGRLHVFENTATGIGPKRYLGRGLGVYDLAG